MHVHVHVHGHAEGVTVIVLRLVPVSDRAMHVVSGCMIVVVVSPLQLSRCMAVRARRCADDGCADEGDGKSENGRGDVLAAGDPHDRPKSEAGLSVVIVLLKLPPYPQCSRKARANVRASAGVLERDENVYV
jgi:hypothetical protein